MNVWRIGTTWGEYPVFDLMVDSRVAFWGVLTDKNTKEVKPPPHVQRGDLIALAEPNTKKVLAIGEAGTDVAQLSQLRIGNPRESELADYDPAWGILMSRLYRLQPTDWYFTKHYTRCYSLSSDQDAYNKTISLFTKMKENEKVNDFLNLLNRAKQIVLTGAPGTGKTYLARQLAMQMILGKPVTDGNNLSQEEQQKLADQMEFVQFHPSFDYTDFVEGLRPVESEDGKSLGFERRDGLFKAFCKKAMAKTDSNFNKAYDNLTKLLKKTHTQENPLELETPTGEKFRVFLNPRNSLSLLTGSSSNTQGSLTPEKIKAFLTETTCGYWEGYYKGVVEYMKSSCELVVTDRKETEKNKPYVFIIDEINRGDIAKIFGELFFAIDKGYRGESKGRVRTQYNNLVERDDIFFDGFFAPDNVYIIGTMNDIDRNVESMDFAIRRRFAWKEIDPAMRFDAMWTDLVNISSTIKDEARQRMNRINKVIANPENGLGKAFQIGPSYFRELENYQSEPDSGFQSLWDNHIKPLIHEYLRGVPNFEPVLKRIQDAYFKAGTDQEPDDLSK